MTVASAQGRGPRRIRQPLKEYEPGAHMYATFGMQWKAGAASLIPFGVIYFTTQPFTEAMQLLATGGYTIGPAVVALFATSWALMSKGLLHVLRFNRSVLAHYITYALVGAVVLLIAGLGTLALLRAWQEGQPDFWNSPAYTNFLIGAPIVGALGSLVGRWTLASGVHWYVWLDRPPLPNALTFVEGKHSKDDYERM